MELSTKIKLKHDIQENWESNDPVLLEGEIAIVLTSSDIRFKIGDGTKHFTQLPYVQSKEAVLGNIVQGFRTQNAGSYSIAAGMNTSLLSSAACSEARGFQAQVSSSNAYAWNGDSSLAYNSEFYGDNGPGTYSINPQNGISGLYVGVKNLDQIVNEGKSCIVRRWVNEFGDERSN